MSEGAWTAVATLDDFAASDAIAVVAAGKEIAIFLVDGAVFATANRCTHGDARLCDGWVEGHEIECPLHQGRFDVRSGAATGRAGRGRARDLPARLAAIASTAAG